MVHYDSGYVGPPTYFWTERLARRQSSLPNEAFAVVFWQQLVGAAVFIGESDRLNTYLNMRLAEYDALRTYGRVPAWNPTMFGGFSVAALHWMNPGTDPIAFFLQLFPRGRVYQALGYVSIALVLAACATAYFYIRDLTSARIPAAIAALCYDATNHQSARSHDSLHRLLLWLIGQSTIHGPTHYTAEDSTTL